VISMEDWVTIRNLREKNPNLGSRKTKKILGISRSTVRRVLQRQIYLYARRISCIF
jgi:DNA invertase Pin-like site-specific DNA recombinase